MFILSQRALKFSLLTVFFAVSAVGHGLHYLPGVAQHQIDENVVSRSACSHCFHHTRDFSGEPGNPDDRESSDDCSVCRVLAQSIDVADRVEPPASTFFIFCDPPPSSSRLNFFVGDYRSRGPPAAEPLVKR